MVSEQPNPGQPNPDPKAPVESSPVLQPYPTQVNPTNGSLTQASTAPSWLEVPGAESLETRAKLDIADSAARFTSGVIDVGILGVAGFIYILNFGTKSTPTPQSPESGQTIDGSAMMWFVVFSLAYFFVTELYLGGSFGKLFLGQQVKSITGDKPTPKQLAVRTILRPIDGLPYFVPNLVGFLVLQSGDQRQRLGDRYANTVVVKVKK